MTYIIQSGSLQYKVKKGDLLPVQKIEGSEGDMVELKLLLSFGEGKISSLDSFQSVQGKTRKQFKDDKIKIVKYKSKSRYRKQRGHRQEMTLVEIL